MIHFLVPSTLQQSLVLIKNSSYKVFKNFLLENSEKAHMANCKFTSATMKLHQLFFSQEYCSDMISAFNVQYGSGLSQQNLGMHLVFCLYKLFAEKLGNLVKAQEESGPIMFRVEDMRPDGPGKVCYIYY